MTTISIDQGLQQVERYISKLVKSFHFRYGGDWHELLSIAHEKFCEAYHSWDPEKGKFITHVHWRVFYGLRDTLRSNRMTGIEARGSRADLDLDYLQAAPKKWSLLSELSEDARAIMKAALATPTCYDGEQKRGFLVGTFLAMGWTAARIMESFQEIREALS